MEAAIQASLRSAAAESPRHQPPAAAAGAAASPSRQQAPQPAAAGPSSSAVDVEEQRILEAAIQASLRESSGAAGVSSRPQTAPARGATPTPTAPQVRHCATIKPPAWPPQPSVTPPTTDHVHRTRAMQVNEDFFSPFVTSTVDSAQEDTDRAIAIALAEEEGNNSGRGGKDAAKQVPPPSLPGHNIFCLKRSFTLPAGTTEVFCAFSLCNGRRSGTGRSRGSCRWALGPRAQPPTKAEYKYPGLAELSSSSAGPVFFGKCVAVTSLLSCFCLCSDHDGARIMIIGSWCL